MYTSINKPSICRVHAIGSPYFREFVNEHTIFIFLVSPLWKSERKIKYLVGSLPLVACSKLPYFLRSKIRVGFGSDKRTQLPPFSLLEPSLLFFLFPRLLVFSSKREGRAREREREGELVCLLSLALI